MANTEDTEVGNVVTDDTFSLADLANLDTSDVAVVMNRLPMAGLWTVMCLSVALSVQKPKEAGQKPLPRITYKFESVKIEPTEIPEDFDPATTAGRKLTDQTTLWPEEFTNEIGIVKGKYKRCGIESNGIMGGTDEVKGWLDNAVGRVIELKVRHAEVKGETRAFIDWVGAPEDSQETA